VLRALSLDQPTPAEQAFGGIFTKTHTVSSFPSPSRISPDVPQPNNSPGFAKLAAVAYFRPKA